MKLYEHCVVIYTELMIKVSKVVNWRAWVKTGCRLWCCVDVRRWLRGNWSVRSLSLHASRRAASVRACVPISSTQTRRNICANNSLLYSKHMQANAGTSRRDLRGLQTCESLLCLFKNVTERALLRMTTRLNRKIIYWYTWAFLISLTVRV